jgi:hypothetical protein
MTLFGLHPKFPDTLEASIRDLLDRNNPDPNPSEWRRYADKILASVGRAAKELTAISTAKSWNTSLVHEPPLRIN